MVILLVNACMQKEGDIWYYIQCWWVCCWIYVLVLSHIFMHTWLMLMDFISVWWCWWILYPCGDVNDVFVASWVDDIVIVDGTVSLQESWLGALHTFNDFVKCVIFDYVFGEFWWFMCICEFGKLYTWCFGEHVKMCTCWCLLLMVILVYLMILIDDVYFNENNEG